MAPTAPQDAPTEALVDTSASLSSRVVGGAFWVAASRWSTMVVSWPAVIVLARLLTPEDYGYLALVTVFTQLAALVAEGGISSTIVLGKELSEPLYRRMHGWSITLFGAAVLLLLLAAVPIERMYDMQGARWLLAALAAPLLLEGITLVPAARMRRELRLRDLSLFRSARVIAEAVSSVAFALAGFRYWSLVLGHVIGRAVETALIFRAVDFTPSWPRFAGLEQPLASARRLLVASVATFLAYSSDAWVGALSAGTVALGGYSFMAGLARAPLDKVSGIVIYVAGSAFGTIGANPRRLASVVVRMARLTAMVMCPLFAGIALVADDLVLGLLGDKWLSYIPALRWLCLYAALAPLHATLKQAAIAAGASRDVAHTGLMLLVVMPPAFYVCGTRFGATGLALAWLFPMPLILERLQAVLADRIGLTRRTLATALFKPLIAVSLMAAVVLTLGRVPLVEQQHAIVRLAFLSSMGALAYSLLVLRLQRDDLKWLLAKLPPRAATTVRRCLRWVPH